MIIFAKEDGRVESSPAFIPKGSGGVPVQVFAPYFAGCTCEVWVLPPTALQLDPAILSPEFGGTPGVWAGKLPPGTAERPGRGDYQLRFTDAEGAAVATLSGTYTVQRGVVDAYPENMGDLSNYSLKAFTILLAQFANQFNDVITSDNLQEEMKEVEYTMSLSKNVLSWGISGKILASVLLTGLIGSTGCVFSEKENRESLATIIESVPIIAETESEAAEINTTRAELVTALRETTDEPDEPIVETHIVTVSLTGAYATINGQTFYTPTAFAVDSGECVTISFGATLAGCSVKPSDGAVIECNAEYTGAEDGDNYAITFTPTADTQVSCAAARVESPAVLSRLEVVASGFHYSVNGYSLYVGEGSPYKKYGDLRSKLTVYAIYTKYGVESSRSTVSSYTIKNESEAISAESGGYAALEISYNGVSNAVLFDLASTDQITSSTLYINSEVVANGATISLDVGTSFDDLVKSHALRMDLVYSVNGAVDTADVQENLFTVEGYDEPGNAWIDTNEVAPGTNRYRIRYGNSAIGYATYELTIEAPPEIFVTSITLSQTNATLKVGESLQLTATVLPENAEHKDIKWYSNSDAVTVENGLVTAIALPGGSNTAIITAQSLSTLSVTASCTFEIQPVLVESITITPSTLSMKVGETAEVSYSFTPANATNPSFEVNVPPEIEVVSHDTANRKVVVKAISEGSVEFAITDSDNYSVYATCQVTVEAVVASNYWASDAVTGGQLPSITFPISDFSASDFEKINYIDITGDKLGTAALGTEISVLRLFRSDSGWDTKEVWRANQSAAGNDIVKSVGFNNGISVQTTNYIFGNAREYTLTCYDDPTSLPVANIDEAYDNGLFNQVGGNSTTFKIMARRNGGLIKQAEGFTSIVIAEDESALSPSYNETNNLYNNKLTLTKSGETWGGVAETSLGNKTVSSATVEVSEDELFGNSVLSVSVKVITSSGGTTDLKFINANKYIGTIVLS